MNRKQYEDIKQQIEAAYQRRMGLIESLWRELREEEAPAPTSPRSRAKEIIHVNPVDGRGKKDIPYVTFPCECCNKKVVISKGIYYGRLNGTGKPPRFCSRSCGAVSRYNTPKKVTLNCAQCHTDFQVKEAVYNNRIKASGKPPQFCSRRCTAIALNPLGDHLKPKKEEEAA